MMSIMRVVFRRGLRVSISASKSRQSNVTSASLPRQSDAYPSPVRAGTDSGKEIRIETREAATRIIGHFNRTCGGLVSTLDQPAIGRIAAKLENYTEENSQAVIDWGNTRWPKGDKWRERCLNITHLFGDKFGHYLTAAGQSKETAAPKVFHPGEEFILKSERRK